MRKQFFLKPLFVLITLPFLHSCATQVSVASCTSQVHYPGQQEVKPYQKIVVTMDSTKTTISIDSLRYGKQTIPLKGKQTTFLGKTEGTSFSKSATLYFSKKSKVDSLQIEKVEQLDPLYLP